MSAPPGLVHRAGTRGVAMKYTIVVPVFNGEDTIEGCLRSLLDQEGVVYGRDYTILVIDDGSTDRTPQIIHQFPVEVVRLPRNEGRIVARSTGAKMARTGKILFVDSRINLCPGTLCKLDRLAHYPAVIGEIDSEATRYDSAFHTIFYLIRRKYYGKKYFPMQCKELWITRENFKRAPKGTTIMLIDRDLFLELIPERTGKDVSDDTLLFHNLVFKKGLALLRSRDLFARYSLRTNPWQFSSWLSHRGVLFSDFYLRPGGYFFYPFLLLLIAAAAILIAGAAASASVSSFVFHIAVIACVLNAVISIYLAENGKDFVRAFPVLPVVVLLFGSGIATFWLRMLRRAAGEFLKKGRTS